MKKEMGFKVLLWILVFVLAIGYAVPVSATNGSFEVTVKVTGFDGTTPLANVYVDMFGNTMNTSRRGECTFKLKNVGDSESYSYRIYDKSSGQTYGDGTITINRADETGIMARPSGGPGQFGLQLYYTDNTSFFYIQSQIDQANVWSVDHLDFDEAYVDPPSEPEPPQFEEPVPGADQPPEEFMEDPDMKFEEPHPDSLFIEPQPEYFNAPWWSRIDPLTASMGAAILVLIILVIILLAKNAKKNRKPEAKKTKE